MKYILITHYAGWSQLYEASSYWDFATRDEHFHYSEFADLADAEDQFCGEEIPEELRDILESGKPAFEVNGDYREDTLEEREDYARWFLRSDVKDFNDFDSAEEAIEYASTHPGDGVRKAVLFDQIFFDVPLYGIAVEIERNGKTRVEAADEEYQSLTISEAKRAMELWSGDGIPRIMPQNEIYDLNEEE